MLILLGAPYKEGVQEEYYTFTDAAALFRWSLTKLELCNVKTTETPVCEANVKYAMNKKKVTLVPEKNLNAILPTDRTPDNIVLEPDIPEYLEAPLKTDQVVGTASVYYVNEKTGEKQTIATVNLVPAENVDHSGIMATIEIAGEIFKSYWFVKTYC